MFLASTSSLVRRTAVCAGDSRQYGNDIPASAMSVQLNATGLHQRETFYNIAVNGLFSTSLAAQYTTSGASHAFAKTGVPWRYIVDVGINDITNDIAAATIYANIAPTLALAKTDGAIVIVFKTFRYTGITVNQTTQLLALHALLAANVSKDLIVDLYSYFTNPSDTSVYEVGGGHLNANGLLLQAQLVYTSELAANLL